MQQLGNLARGHHLVAGQPRAGRREHCHIPDLSSRQRHASTMRHQPGQRNRISGCLARHPRTTLGQLRTSSSSTPRKPCTRLFRTTNRLNAGMAACQRSLARPAPALTPPCPRPGAARPDEKLSALFALPRRLYPHGPAADSLTLTTARLGEPEAHRHEGRRVTMGAPGRCDRRSFLRRVALWAGTTCRIFGFSTQCVECMAVVGGWQHRLVASWGGAKAIGASGASHAGRGSNRPTARSDVQSGCGWTEQ